MVNPINNAGFTNAYRMYESGALHRLARETTIRGYNLSGCFPFESVQTKKTKVLEEVQLDQLTDPLTKKALKKAKGAEARRVRGITPTATGITLSSDELIIEIDNDDLKDPTLDIPALVMSGTYHLGLGIEDHVSKALKANAVEVPAGNLTGSWDTGDYRTMSKDIMKFQKENLNTPYAPNMVAMGSDAKIELASVITETAGNFTVNSTGFTIENVQNINGVNCFYGGIQLEDGELLGFNTNEYPLKVYFKEYENPYVKKAPVAKGLENVAPPINVLMYNDADKETEPCTTIKLATAYYAQPMGKKALLFKDVMS